MEKHHADELQNPFDDSNAVGEDEPTRQPSPEPPYHVFTKAQKRIVVGIIGVAGLFSGLSSNIYFPSQDAIAKARLSKLATTSELPS